MVAVLEQYTKTQFDCYVCGMLLLVVQVVAVLQGLVMVEGSTPQSTPRRPRSLSLSSSKMSSMPFHSNATAVVSAPAVVNAAAQQGHAKAAAAAAAPRQTQQVCTAGALGGMPETVVAVQQPCDQQAAFESNFLTASKGCCVIA